MAFSKVSLSLVLLFFVSLSFSYANSRFTHDRTNSSQSQAQTLIRSLNLFPKKPVNIVKGDHADFVPGKIVENKFSFFAQSGSSVEDLGHHAGYFSLPHSIAARMFYFFFESRNNKDDPVIIWLAGGPGCSSELALFYENGPFHIANNLSLVWNVFGWDQVYDIRKKCVGSLCYDFSNLERLLNLQNVKSALGVANDLEYVPCSITVHNAMREDWMRNLEGGIPSLLEDGIKMLVYVGDKDLICNWLGNSRWVHAMEWSGQNAFGTSLTLKYVVDGAEAGFLKSYGPLTFLRIFDAGHLVPMDQPNIALEMLKGWMGGTLMETKGDN
uniref:Serine carboxypeptidase-like 49 n=1 Tax=Cajanus cajan TaxID=3821 RepID=A0A151TNF0_CAJCA|nr:Serine carboxypeptidase-like 49 [Cajanus cajan]